MDEFHHPDDSTPQTKGRRSMCKMAAHPRWIKHLGQSSHIAHYLPEKDARAVR